MSGVVPAKRCAAPVPLNLMIDTVSLSTASIQPMPGHFCVVTSRLFGSGRPAFVKESTSCGTVVRFKNAGALGALDRPLPVWAPHPDSANAVIRTAAASRPLIAPTLADGNQIRLVERMPARTA